MSASSMIILIKRIGGYGTFSHSFLRNRRWQKSQDVIPKFSPKKTNLLLLSLGSPALGKASCHVIRTLKLPHGVIYVARTWGYPTNSHVREPS